MSNKEPMNINKMLPQLIELRTRLKSILKEVENCIAKLSPVAELYDYAAITSFVQQNKESLTVGDKILLKSPNVLYEYRGVRGYGTCACAFFVSVTPEYDGNMNVWLDK